jgi:hypothetical protein
MQAHVLWPVREKRPPTLLQRTRLAVLRDKIEEDEWESCVILMRQPDGSQASQRRRGVLASSQLRESQALRRSGVKSTLENGTSRQGGFSNWQHVTVV